VVIARRCAPALALLAVTAATAAAHPVRRHGIDPLDPPPIELLRRPPPPAPPPPPPAPPRPPRWQSLGHRMGVATFDVDAHHRFAFSYGLAWGVELAGRVRGFVDYDFLVVTTGDTLPDGTRESPNGRGHSLATGVRLPLLGGELGRDQGATGTRLRLYADAKLGVAGVVLTDDLIGEHALVQGVAGVRLGMELARGSDQPQGRTRTFDSHFTVSATGVPGAITWSFALGMDWGR
jgi:hypothetical protein